ncbi:protein FAM107B isoform X1 [Zeugodacus cucurbitae]|uniref:protein FAM107B isoform X1 n=1 Tax=Zeugodacus cucurbitae TaxID=28588 RepID=UPI0010A74AF0|nr:protein FAM107B isoform X1 [Zeugodacus cucurbitae]
MNTSTDSSASITDSPTKRSTTATTAATSSQHSPIILTAALSSSTSTSEKIVLREPESIPTVGPEWFEHKRQAISSALAANERTTTTITMMMSSPPPGVQKDADGLILPRKLINPCLESNERQQLHRELKFNNKMGKSVLNQKSELQRAYEKQRERQQRQQHQEDLSPTAGLKAELNRVIMERAQKHERQEGGEDEEDKQYVNPEYLNARAKLRQQRASELK